jgi:hypothetical protein
MSGGGAMVAAEAPAEAAAPSGVRMTLSMSCHI